MISSHAGADGLACASRPSDVVIAAAPQPAAAAKRPSPRQARRQDLPGARSRPADEPGQQAGYLPAAMTGNHAPAPAGGGALCSSRPRFRPTGSPQTQRAGQHRCHQRQRADARSAAFARPGYRAGPPARNHVAASSGTLREAPVTSASILTCSPSDTDPGAPLAPPGGQDRAPRPGAHAQPEPVRLGAAAIVRLKRALAHGCLPVRSLVLPTTTGERARERCTPHG